MKRFRKIVKWVMIVTLSGVVVLGISAFVYLQHPKFGKAPSGKRLVRIRKSPNYRNGKFQNKTETPTFAGGHTFWGEVRKSLFNKYPGRSPLTPIPSIKTHLLNLPVENDVLVWFGHSSCFIQLDGKRLLIDPVFSTNASPISGSVKAFEGTSLYSVSDLPDIDYLLISHDHYDHLDYESVIALKNKTKKVICGLGVGSHFEHWGYDTTQIIEKDWHEKEEIDSTFAIYTEPARHKSGRGLKQNNTLWLSFIVKSARVGIYISGDSGYDGHFAEIGKKFGPIDLAIMENGQYDSAWHLVHLLPEETIKGAQDLKARRILPVHNSKFVLARHSWDEPLKKLVVEGATYNIPVISPLIGETVNLNNTSQTFVEWWKGVDKNN